MKNLKLLYKLQEEFDKNSAKLLIRHPFENCSYIYNNDKLQLINHSKNEIQDLFEAKDVIAMEYIQLNNAICLATESGDIILYYLENHEHEVVGMLGDGISAMCFSPDQELVVFVTSNSPKNMVLFHSTFDPYQETPLSEDQQPENQFMSVGWGKKETQFHGSEGKQAAKKKEEFEAADPEVLDQTVNVSWRGDGEFYAVSFVGANGRMFNVFNKEGILQFASEKVSLLESSIAWRISGNWIAIPHVYPSKYVISLFEKNGLRHQEIPLPFKKENESVKKLAWSNDSEILLIETVNQKNEQEIYSIYLYVIGNYHWYLKQFWEFSKKINYCWSSNYMEPKMLHLLDSDGNYFTYKWDYTINKSNGKSDTDESLIAVIDDSQVLLTNFKSQVVPPPMSSNSIKLDCRINFVDFLVTPSSETLDTNSFFTFTSDSQVRFYKTVFKNVTNGRMIEEVQEFNRISLKDFAGDQSDSLYYSHPLWLNENYFFLANNNELIILKLESQSFQLQDQFEFEKVIGGLICSKRDSVIIQFVDGSINEILVTGDSFLNEVGVAKLPEYCEKFLAISRKGQPEVFGLKNIKKKLFMNDLEIGNEVTSFAITLDSDFLMYTTISELKFLDISQKNFNFKNPIYKRRVERGSKIVGCVKNKSQTILQMPRGNLEVINPRILSLKIIKRHLEEKEYRLTFDLLRKERINLNLFFDLNPDRFIEDLAVFVEQIDNIQWLNLFLTDLKNEDVTKTMFSFCESSESTIFNQKIEFVCGKMIELLYQLDPVKFLLPIITCYVKLEQFDKALEVIWDLKKTGARNKEADDAFKYLLYLIDINPLYNVALGMYDYNLVSYVAQKSQKDPKEYLPFLNELKNLDQNYARYKIDCFLKRHDKAISNISNMENSDKLDECLELIKKHNLYNIGMKTFVVKNEEFYKKICNLYADHLRVQGKLLEASLMYERGGDYNQAINSSRNLMDWRRIISLSKKNGLHFDEIRQTIENLKILSTLESNDRYQEAVELFQIFYPEDKLRLIEILVKGKMFSKAILEASISSNESLVESTIKPEVENCLEVILRNLEDDKNMFQQQKERLLKIREEKLRKQQNIEEGIEDDDAFSDSTSLMDSSKYSESSKASSKTFKSSKNRRKHEKKLLNLKEGNKYEDIALIDSLHKLVLKLFDSQQQTMIKEVLKVALELNLDELGLKVQRTFRQLLLFFKESLDEIWIPEMVTSAEFPTGPNIDYQMYTNELRYALIKPHQRFKPHDLNVIDFEIEFFKENKSKK